MKRLLFFINPNAGHAEIRGTLMEVLEIFSAGGYEVTVHMTTGPRDLTRQIAARGAQYDLIVCTGGDGTLNEDRKSTRLNSSHSGESRMPSSA